MLRRKLCKVLVKIRNFLCVLLLILFLLVYRMIRIQENEVVTKIPQNAIKYVEFEQRDDFKPLQINTIKSYITEYNSEERVLNLDVFGPLQSSAPVFVIFVDKFKVNLKYLLVSLSNVAGIDDALIIFSHSRFDENVNNLIKIIDFARVLQIFYPYSMQIYPNEFPGYQKGDCPRNIDMDTAKALNCTGADTPDLHGLYRDPLRANMKHYWWWTMNKVFENLLVIHDHTGIFTFLDDDVFLMEDFIYMTIKIKKVSQFITACEFTSLLTPLFEFPYFNNSTFSPFGVELTTWDPKDHSSVYSFDSSVWSSIAAHYSLFCSIDEDSWARSLYYLSLNRKDGGRFKVMSSILPRAFKTSSSAFYEQYVDYDLMHTINQILHIQEQLKVNLYPSHLEVFLNIELDDDEYVIFDYVDSGGWSDPRDKNMCFNITTSKIKRVIMDMAHELHQYKLIRFKKFDY